MSTLTLNVSLIPNVMAQDYGYDASSENYYDNSKYSKYPTEINKYECRTGPFEGFFVSSVEFCKKISVKENNGGKIGDGEKTTGPTGPQGDTGAQGPRGLTGP